MQSLGNPIRGWNMISFSHTEFRLAAPLGVISFAVNAYGVVF
jgi:hypothetical protein